MKNKRKNSFIVYSGDPELQAMNDQIQWLAKSIKFLKYEPLQK